MATWQVNQARNHWSDVLDQAESEGPQIITHHGKERAVVLSIEAYRKIQPEPETKLNFIEFLMSGPKFDFDDSLFERDKSTDEHRQVPFSDDENLAPTGEDVS